MEAFLDAPAGVTLVARIGLLFRAIQGLGQRLCHRLLAAVARPGEQIRMGDAAVLQAPLQLLGNG